jgi:hypothetical protein
MTNLKKIIDEGSLRWIGQEFEGLFPSRTVIAGKTIESIRKAVIADLRTV